MASFRQSEVLPRPSERTFSWASLLHGDLTAQWPCLGHLSQAQWMDKGNDFFFVGDTNTLNSYPSLPHHSRDKITVSFLMLLLLMFYIRVRFGLMVWIWEDTGKPGALKRLFTSLDPCSAPPCPTTSQCWSWRGPRHTYGFSSWTGLSSVPLLKGLDRFYIPASVRSTLYEASLEVWPKQSRSNLLNESTDTRKLLRGTMVCSASFLWHHYS